MIKRYETYTWRNPVNGEAERDIRIAKKGDLVYYRDYKELEEENKELQDKVKELSAKIKELTYLMFVEGKYNFKENKND